MMTLSTVEGVPRIARKMDRAFCFFMLVVGIVCVDPLCNAVKRPFTLRDDIELSHFGDPYTFSVPPVLFSPNGKYFIVITERGLLKTNQVESTLRVFATKNVHNFVVQPNPKKTPLVIWALSKVHKEGPVITEVHWLPSSSAFAFLARGTAENRQLLLADLKSKSVRALTVASTNVMAYDIRRPTSYVFAAQSVNFRNRAIAERRAMAIVGTRRPLESLIFPTDFYPSMSQWYDLSELWAVLDGRRFRLRDKSSGRILLIHQAGLDTLALSPDGRFAVSALAFDIVPPEWEALYPPPPYLSAFRIRSGKQKIEALDGRNYLSEYVLIELSSGIVKPLTNAPIASLWGATKATWSPDGRLLVLSNAFLSARSDISRRNEPNVPCLTQVDPRSGVPACIERLSGAEWGSHFIKDVHFAWDSNSRIVVDYFSGESVTYTKNATGTWITDTTAMHGSSSDRYSLDVAVRESFGSPPLLIGRDTSTRFSRVIWDPNPQLNEVNLADASVFTWKDKTGRDWVAGLYKPAGQARGVRYPLVIQTHGFIDSQFRASGIFPTAFAAQELVAEGFVVLQVRDCHYHSPAEEGPCNVAGYEAAIETLVADGLVDPDRVGIIGFSRTCYYVLEALTTSTFHFKAASITDGVNEGYLQYVANVDSDNNNIAHDADTVIGAPPLKEGLQQWLKNSPPFNMDKVATPLQVVALGRPSALFMWEPYALLRYLNHPVDLIVLNSYEHVLSNPAVRTISQGNTVDWFRFWLMGEEDPNPAKAEQYSRWRELRTLQEKNENRPVEALAPVSR